MDITFGHLYESVIQLERGLIQLERDIDNMSCDYATKCILEDELENIRAQVDSLLETEVAFRAIDFAVLLSRINHCLDCIEISTK